LRQWSRQPFPVSSTAGKYSEEKAKVKLLPVCAGGSVNFCPLRHCRFSLSPWQVLLLTCPLPKAQSLCPMLSTYAFAAAFLIGFICGLRSLTGPAVTAWSTRFGWISLRGTPLAFLGSWPAVGLFTFLAIVEYFTDKLPKTPPRTAPLGLSARVLLGALSGAALAASRGNQLGIGAALGALGGVVGAFVGYQLRTRIVKALAVPDFYVAVGEDLVAILGGLAIISYLRP
jgi:uncharacterized membrane protein